ncbi:LysR substrate-binding domain-containing protein [Pseudoroseicyclus tamaricis]|uniref:LysR family transcriptional regulator n=1 Tax=Pseudoroseicyclus tamaricis TaxID=2705421 RepID=A0A6B2JUC4_9RHOB|nr:LysR substrate-binding domain-containing protein [Pseudoroseicyclus tamaricis]NDV00209.1 LysR family transcriptional regulator [Pseudoroseicyclus tamaricis]
MDRLPPLRLLATFEAVARLGSMRAAAASLNVTQPAVTQALKALEDHVGAPLLDRATRPARLTAAGEQLARVTREGLGQIGAAIDDIRARADLAEAQVTVACTLGMATYWLMPRLPAFYAAHPDITVNVQAPPTDLPALSPGIDVALRYGEGEWRDGPTHRLFEERVCPVGRPDLLARLVELPAAPLIHVRSAQNLHWAGWPEYLSARGLPRARQPGQSFDNYVQATQAALDGRGLMLGWRSITARLVAEGALAQWPDGEVDLGTAYWLTEGPAPSSGARAFLAWLRSLQDRP